MSKKQLLLNSVVLVALVLSLASVSVLAAPPCAPALQAPAWFDAAWAYRRPVTISNSGSLLTDYQVQITLDGSFDFSKALPDGSDLRVTNSDGTTALPFWIETWNPPTSARIWVEVPSIPVGDSTVYLYYGNQGASSASSGDDTFEFFDDFESPSTAYGYYSLGNAQIVLVQDQAWETSSPHTLSVVEYNHDGYAYWGYYGLTSGNGGVGLARSNDLVTWVKYENNPLFYNGRFPSVIKVGDTFYMMVTKDYGSTSHIVLRTSTDGINFTEVETVVPPISGRRNQNPNLFYNPNDNRYYLYWYSNNSGQFDIKAKSAEDVLDLDIASEVTVVSSPSVLAAPNMMYYDNTYFLSTEIHPGEWQVRTYASDSSPISGFVELPDNPILENGSACFFQHVFGDTLHAYYCKLTGGTWTVDYRTADLSAGRTEIQSLDSNKWTASGGAWTLATTTQQDGSSGMVANGTTSARQILYSSFSGNDYILEAHGKQVSGRVWGLGIRATDRDNLYSVNLYEDLDHTNNLYTYRWASGSATTVADTAVGTVDLNTWYKMAVGVHSTNIDVYLDDVLRLQGTDSAHSSGRVALYGEQDATAQFNDVFVRKYASPEPSVSVGSEESSTPPNPPPLPSSFYGEIHYAAGDPGAPGEGDTVEAYLSGSVVATTTITTTQAITLVYSIDVPGDDASASYPITFTISARTVATATWASGTNVNLDFHPPYAVDDSGTTCENTAVVINVLSNDDDAVDPGTLSVSDYEATSTQGGTVSCTAGGACTYTPPSDWSGSDSFTYTAKDANGGTGTATVNVTVNVTTAITDHPDDQTVHEGNTATFSVSADGTSLTYQWQVNTGSGWNDISGEENSSYTTGALAVGDNGNQYRCVVTGACGTGTSTAATVTVYSTHSLTLQVGWNLVSFNLQPVSTVITDVLSSLVGAVSGGDYDLVYAWDATVTPSGEWQLYAPGTTFDQIPALDEKMGFWIHITAGSEVTLDIDGTAPGATNIDLHDDAGGWNLVGYPSAQPSTGSGALPGVLDDHGVSGKYSLVYAYHADDTTDPWKLYDVSAPSWSNDLAGLDPGYGQWIEVSVGYDYTWSVDY